MLKCLYGRDKVEDVTSSEAVAKLEALYHEKSNLVLEVEELQRSVSGLSLSYNIQYVCKCVYLQELTVDCFKSLCLYKVTF